MRALARRIDRLEAKGDATARPVPRILFVGMSETQTEAHARFAEAFPHRQPGHAVLCLPAKPKTADERTLWATRFHAGQVALVADARSARATETITPPAPPRRWSNSPTIRPNGPHVTWKANA